MKKLAALCLTAVCALAAAAPVEAHAKPLPTLTPVAHDALTRALEHGRLTEAQYALERARSLFSLQVVRREFGNVAKPGPRAATPLLRDLAVRVGFLSGSARRDAAALLARPPANQTTCDLDRPLCYHWTNGGPNGTSPADVSATMATIAAVWDLEVQTYGFLAPLPDNDGPTDIYLRDLGSGKNPLFGYCTSDDPHASDPNYPYRDVWAYCVLDNDFSQAQFGTSQTPQEFRDVTAAHEFFHAIQFHYDFYEDLWLMEGTAMMMEGQFRPDVKDRIRYLANSTLTSPPTPVDFGAGGFEYGAWIFWRFLVEDRGELANPLVIRQVWKGADASSDEDGPGPDTVGPDAYSLLAVRRVLAARGLNFRQVFAHFAWVNRVPRTFYSEGADYPAARIAAAYTLGRSRRTTGWRSYTIKHLAQRYVVFRPSRNAPARMRIRVRVDLPGPRTGPVANLLLHYVGGTLAVRPIELDTAGDGSRVVSLGRRARVRKVELVLTNASTRFHCWQRTDYSCAGRARDDFRTYRFRARVL
jgi:hypothetical protein